MSLNELRFINGNVQPRFFGFLGQGKFRAQTQTLKHSGDIPRKPPFSIYPPMDFSDSAKPL